jgi:hypothetical protein
MFSLFTCHHRLSCSKSGWCHLNNRSFTLLHNLYWNWFMSVASSHDMLQINRLKFDVYTAARRCPWWRAHSLLVDVCFLLEFSEVPLNSSITTLRSLSTGDCCLNKRVNNVKAMGWKHSKIYNSITLAIYLLVNKK